MKNEETIDNMISDIKYDLRNDLDLEMLIKEGLKLILDKIKDQKKWKNKN